MGVDVVDLHDRSRSIHASWWQWRPTAELIRSLGLFDGKRLDHLSDGFGEFTQDEAQQMADALERQVLPGLQPNQRILLDGTATAEPDDGTFYRVSEEQRRNYSADYDWLVRFVAFCKEAGGVYIF